MKKIGWKDFPSKETPISAENLKQMEENMEEAIDEKQENINKLEKYINNLASGSPLVANSINEMTDINRVYVNSTNGHWYWHNGTDWIDGGVYQATEDSKTVEELKEKLSGIITKSRNLFNPQTVVNGFFMNTNGDAVENEAFAYNLIEVEYNKIYSCTGTNFNISFFDENMNRLGGDTNSNGVNNYTFNTKNYPSVKFVAISFRPSSYPTSSYMFNEGDSLLEFEEFGKFLVVEQTFQDYIKKDDMEVIVHDVSVKKDGTGDFSNVFEAVSFANKRANKKNIYNIYVFDTSTNYKGTSFDILEEMGGNDYLSTITDTSNIQKGMPLNNYVNLIGIGQVKLYAHLPDDCTLAQSTCFSTIEIFGNSTLDNLTIEIKNGRYPVHDESNNNNPKTTHSFNKCKFIHLGNASGLWKNCHAYASGTSGGCIYNYKDCIFDASVSGGYPYDLHNYAPQLGSDISLDGCIMKKSPSQLVSIKFGFNGYSPVTTDPVAYESCHNNVFLKNIIADGIIQVGPENYSYNCTNNFVLHNFTGLEVVIKDDVII